MAKPAARTGDIEPGYPDSVRKLMLGNRQAAEWIYRLQMSV